MKQTQKTKQVREQEEVEELPEAETDRESLLDEIDQVLENIDECIQKHGKTTCPCGEPLSECFWYNDDGTMKPWPFGDD